MIDRRNTLNGHFENICNPDIAMSKGTSNNDGIIISLKPNWYYVVCTFMIGI